MFRDTGGSAFPELVKPGIKGLMPGIEFQTVWGLVGTNLGSGPVSGDLVSKTGAVDLIGQVLLEGDADLGVVVVGSVAIVSDHGTGVNVLLNGSAERIGDRNGDVAESGNQRAGVYQEVLTVFLKNEPVEELLGSSLLLLGDRVVDEEVLGAAADELLIVTIKVRREQASCPCSRQDQSP